MTNPNEFQGKPWMAEPSPTWNEAATWDAYYEELLSKAGRASARDRALHCEMDLLLRVLPRLGEVPRRSGQVNSTILDAGCGISLIPEVLAFWGFRVTAVDSSSHVIQAIRDRRPREIDLAKCIPVLELSASGNSATSIEDPDRSLQLLRNFRAEGGSLRQLLCDWHDERLLSESFHLIYCRNGLRCAPKPYWRHSLERFHRLLAPGGVLILETNNAIDLEEEVAELVSEVSFTLLPWTVGRLGHCTEPVKREQTTRYALCWWPTG
jgi:SAM-dependent methyltransferase